MSRRPPRDAKNSFESIEQSLGIIESIVSTYSNQAYGLLEDLDQVGVITNGIAEIDAEHISMMIHISHLIPFQQCRVLSMYSLQIGDYKACRAGTHATWQILVNGRGPAAELGVLLRRAGFHVPMELGQQS